MQVEKQVIIILRITEEERHWLHEMTRNATVTQESSQEARIRKDFFDASEKV